MKDRQADAFVISALDEVMCKNHITYSFKNKDLIFNHALQGLSTFGVPMCHIILCYSHLVS